MRWLRLSHECAMTPGLVLGKLVTCASRRHLPLQPEPSSCSAQPQELLLPPASDYSFLRIFIVSPDALPMDKCLLCIKP